MGKFIRLGLEAFLVEITFPSALVLSLNCLEKDLFQWQLNAEHIPGCTYVSIFVQSSSAALKQAC